MSYEQEKTVITLKIELPKEFADGLSDLFWTRLELLIAGVFRLSLPEDSNIWSCVWRAG